MIVQKEYGQMQKQRCHSSQRRNGMGLQLFMGENDNNGVLETGEGAMCSPATWQTGL